MNILLREEVEKLTVQYPKMKKQHLYQEVANELERMIIENTLKVGEKLPPENELAENFGVSRNILREAAKILKERGFINHMPGKGAYIVRPSFENLSNIFNRLVLFGQITKKQIFEVRIPLEIAAVTLAAERANKKHITILHDLINQMLEAANDIDEWCSNQLKFHVTIAEASGNPLFLALINPLANLIIELFADGYKKDKIMGVKLGILGHEKIYHAIKKGNKDEAIDSMKEHLLKSEHWITSLE